MSYLSKTYISNLNTYHIIYNFDRDQWFHPLLGPLLGKLLWSFQFSPLGKKGGMPYGWFPLRWAWLWAQLLP